METALAGVRAFLFVLAFAACGSSHRPSGGGDANTGPHDLTGIAISPANPIIEVDLNASPASAAQALVVTGTYSDGSTADLSQQVTWTVENAAVGTITNATLQTPVFTTATAVVSKIDASYMGFAGLAQVTVVAYRKSGPQTDFFFVLPYEDTNGPQNKPLDFSTAIPGLDVLFNVDTTGSMGGEISAIESSITTTIIPGIRSAVMDSDFGVDSLDDFPEGGHGTPDCEGGLADEPFILLQPITGDLAAVSAAVNMLSGPYGGTMGCGDDLPEAGIESIYQAATGDGLTGPSPTTVPVDHSGIGGAEFRTNTLPVIVTVSDAISHGPGESDMFDSECGTVPYEPATAAYAHSRSQTKDALNAICARSVGIAPIPGFENDCDAMEYMTYLATASGARVPTSAWDYGTRPAGCDETQCCTGQGGIGVAPDADGLCPLVFQVSTSGTGVSDSIVTGIQMLARFATFTVPTETAGQTTDINGNPLPTPHTTADFLKSIVPQSYTLPPPPPTLPAPSFDSTTFYNVTPGTIVTFTVDAYNDFIMQTDQAQIFEATITVTAGGCSTIALDKREVLILVPPTPVVVQ